MFLLTGLAGTSQMLTKPVIVEPKIHTGMILPFYEALDYLILNDIYAFDLSLSFPTYGKDYWEKLYRHPQTGIGYAFWSLSNKEVFGNAHAIYTFINIPLVKQSENFSFNYQLSFGGAYLTRKFDVYENHLNRAIGSHANVYIRLGLDCKIRLFPRSNLVIEGGTTHFSNGKTRSPNYGINIGSFSLGFNYLLNSKSITFQDLEIPGIGKRHVQSVIASAGSKVYDNLTGTRYFISSVSYNMERLINHKMRIGLGSDFSYDGSISEALASDDGKPERDFKKLVRFGLHASYGIRYKQIVMGVQVGHYLYSKYIVLTPVYNRISLQYLFPNNMIGRISIKSHMGKADCMEFGAGYCW